jgi:hypothetical protein
MKSMFYFNIVLVISSFAVSIVYCQLSLNQQAENKLVTNLFKNYSRTVRPDVTVDISVSIQLKQIISLDEKNQILSTTSFISQKWFDPRLSWDTALNDNIEVIMVSLKNIWLPDTMIINSASGDGYLKLNGDFGYCSIFYDGFVYFISPAIALQTRCALEMSDYPFDEQTCNIRLASWAFGDNKLKYSLNDSDIDLTDYTPHNIWKLSSTKLKTAAKGDRTPFEATQSTEINLELVLTRKPLYYMMNSIFPCFILNIVTLVSFFMPTVNAITIGK